MHLYHQRIFATLNHAEDMLDKDSVSKWGETYEYTLVMVEE